MGQISKIESRIFTIRGLQVMLDRDLAELYQVPVKALNQAVKRNTNRFPERFRFQLEKTETNELVTNCDRFKSLKHSSVLPCAFTESGVAMLSTILRSDIAVSVCVKIMDAFVAMRKILSTNTGIIQRLETVEIKQIETDKKIDAVFNALQSKDAIPKCGIFFDGQIFDAYVLVNNCLNHDSLDFRISLISKHCAKQSRKSFNHENRGSDVFDNRQERSLSHRRKLEGFRQKMVCFFKNGAGRTRLAG